MRDGRVGYFKRDQGAEFWVTKNQLLLTGRAGDAYHLSKMSAQLLEIHWYALIHWKFSGASVTELLHFFHSKPFRLRKISISVAHAANSYT